MAKTAAKYKDTQSTFLTVVFNGMRQRTRGIATNRPYLYKDLPICDKTAFVEWANTDKDFAYLFKAWEKSGYDSNLTPSLDRIDATEGYILGNMRWITTVHNKTLGSTNNIIHMDGKQVKPLLAAKLEDVNKLKFPVYVSPKLDGIRCLVIDGKAVTRKLKPIPNDYIRTQLETQFKDLNVDGELMVPGMDFNGVQGEVMRKTGEPRFTFVVFDIVNPDLPFEARRELLTDPRIDHPLQGVKVGNVDFLLQMEKSYLDMGYEGAMIRSPEGKYKYGRSGVKEAILLKLKRFEDSEARVIGFEPKYHNANEAKKDALGHTERSSAKEGMVALDTLGSLLVYDPVLDVQFSIGTGFDDAQRKDIWDNRADFEGKLVTYTFQELSKYGVPRFPVWKGFRSEDDISE